MKKKALALAVAGAFFAPASYAAQDTSGMQYTSAAEGFYASIRAKFGTESKKDGGAGIDNSSSRFGVRGSNDLGGGLNGFYQYEAGVSIDNGGSLSTRVGQVGLEGNFGRVWVGSGWTEGYNMVYGTTDVANTGSGSIVYGKTGGMRPGRANNMVQYRTPDISGFQGALGVNMKAGADNQLIEDDSDDSNVEMWTLAAKYGVQGFTGAFAYSVRPDTDLGIISGDFLTKAEQDALKMAVNADNPVVSLKKEDYSVWTAKLGYAQDNWYVNGWYGKNKTSDLGVALDLNGDGDTVDAGDIVLNPEDTRFVSIAGGVSVGKVNMYAVWDQLDYGNAEDATTIVGVQYNLGSRSRVWMDFVNQDLDSDSKAEDHVNVGLRHDF